MSNDNATVLVGNATRDPELRFTPSGVAVANFGLAVNRKWKDGNDEWQEKTTFIDVTCWQQLAENVAESIQKGDRVVCIGRLDMQTWDDKDSGKPRSKIELIADEVSHSLRWATSSATKNPRAESGREPDFTPSGRSSSRSKPASGDPGPSGPESYDEEPFRLDAGAWWPEVEIGPSWPSRLLP